MSLLADLVKNLFSKPATILYPKEPVAIPACFRGRVRIEVAKCIGCSRCALVCPAQCITMMPDQTEIEVKGKKITRKKRPKIDIMKCIRCGLCEDNCPTEAIALTMEFTGASTTCTVEEL